MFTCAAVFAPYCEYLFRCYPPRPHVNDGETLGWRWGRGDWLGGLPCLTGAEPRLAATSPTLSTGPFPRQQTPPHILALSPAHTWASCSSFSSDVEPLVWTLPLDSLVSMRAGVLGFEDAGAPLGRACGGKPRPSGTPDPPSCPSPWGASTCSLPLLTSGQKPWTLGNFTAHDLL